MTSVQIMQHNDAKLVTIALKNWTGARDLVLDRKSELYAEWQILLSKLWLLDDVRNPNPLI